MLVDAGVMTSSPTNDGVPEDTSSVTSETSWWMHGLIPSLRKHSSFRSVEVRRPEGVTYLILMILHILFVLVWCRW
jgi:hypothetical protein